MASARLSRRLNPTDATFLYVERKHAPMHIGSINILESEVSYEEFIEDLERRLPDIPRFQQKVVPTPLNIGHPTWETAKDFNLHNHVHLHQAAAPGGRKELNDVLARVYSGLLDRRRPLWEMHLIIGLEGGKCAVASKVHHAMVDGVGGQELIGKLLDIHPEHRFPSKKSEPLSNATSGNRIVDAVLDNTVTGIDAWSNYLKSVVEGARNLDATSGAVKAATVARAFPDIFAPVRGLPFNKDGSGNRRMAWNEISFAEARAIRRSLDCSVNDVILTTMAGGLSRYAERHGQSVDRRSIKFLMPVNTRPEDSKADLGNRISILPVRLPLGIKDPLERLEAITGTTKLIKAAGVTGGMGNFGALFAANVPVPMQAQLGTLLSNIHLVLFNTLITNVPGPQIPLYQVGRRVESMIPFAPVGYNLGVGCAILSYNQKLNIALTADSQSCQDVETLNELVADSFLELRDAAGVEKIEEVSIRPPKRRKGKAPARHSAESGEESPEHKRGSGSAVASA